MSSRLLSRSRIVMAALGHAFDREPAPCEPASVLIAHHPKMIGDTLLMSPLFAKARHVWPRAEIVAAVSPAMLPLYASRPWQVEAIEYDPTNVRTLSGFRRPGGFDLAIVPGDNRYGWFARAAGARWIVGFDDDSPRYKNLLLDELHRYPDAPDTWGDMAAGLIEGPEPPPYDPSQWPAPAFAAFEMPSQPYAVIHLGTSTLLKRWLPERWMQVADHLSSRGLLVMWSAGRGEENLVAECDPRGRFRSLAGLLDLAQMWHLLAHARILVTPDTGISHLGRITFTPTVTLFGPGTPQLVGSGRFFRKAPWKAAIIDPFPCRDQPILYKRRVEWVRRCTRSIRECPAPRCMHAIEVADVRSAIASLDPELA
jgi:ADP-heptose:LPS heptosyltransferase